ncbi:UNVERIFIED_CONTAM: hypothetical protein HDU68_012763 [Siphonaria sp. JEL0065]|nr:hypothetical protein HDU68_012763 [Siphonaria sp. JEL0065]
MTTWTKRPKNPATELDRYMADKGLDVQTQGTATFASRHKLSGAKTPQTAWNWRKTNDWNGSVAGKINTTFASSGKDVYAATGIFVTSTHPATGAIVTSEICLSTTTSFQTQTNNTGPNKPQIGRIVVTCEIDGTPPTHTRRPIEHCVTGLTTAQLNNAAAIPLAVTGTEWTTIQAVHTNLCAAEASIAADTANFAARTATWQQTTGAQMNLLSSNQQLVEGQQVIPTTPLNDAKRALLQIIDYTVSADPAKIALIPTGMEIPVGANLVKLRQDIMAANNFNGPNGIQAVLQDSANTPTAIPLPPVFEAMLKNGKRDPVNYQDKTSDQRKEPGAAASLLKTLKAPNLAYTFDAIALLGTENVSHVDTVGPVKPNGKVGRTVAETTVNKEPNVARVGPTNPIQDLGL